MSASSQESSFRDHERDAVGSAPIRFAIVTFSDTRTPETDRSGAVLRELIEQAKHQVVGYAIVPDDPVRMTAQLKVFLADAAVEIIVTSGSTGISARDTACEVVGGLFDQRLDGFGELFRMLSFEEIGAAAMLSRASGGIAAGKVLLSLPGSTNAVRLGMTRLILPQAAHLVKELRKHAGESPA